MQVSVETTGSLERRMRVSVPADRVEREIQDRLRNVGKRAKLKGFRPGKVPFKVIKQRYGGQVRQEVINDLVRESYARAVDQEKLNPASGPRIEPTSTGEGKDLEFTAVFEVLPDIALADLSKLRIERPVAEIAETDIDSMVENLRRQKATWNEVDRAAAEGDQVRIDFEGTIKGEAFPGGHGENVEVVIGDSGLLADFEAGLKGMSAGQESKVKVKFPKDYPTSELAGKKAEFQVRCQSVREQVLPELNDEFCKLYDVAEGGLDALREEVKANMQRELQDSIRRRLREQVIEALVAAHPIELPSSMVHEESHRLQQESVAGREGAEPPPMDRLEPAARRRVLLKLLFAEIIRSQDMRVDRQRVEARIRDIAEGYEDPEEIVRLYRSSAPMMQQMEGAVLEEQVVDYLIDQAQASDKKATFSELMHFGQ